MWLLAVRRLKINLQANIILLLRMNSTHLMDTGSEAYGNTDGQLGAMKAAGFDAAVSSPPYEKALIGGGIAKKGYQNDILRKGRIKKNRLIWLASVLICQKIKA